MGLDAELWQLVTMPAAPPDPGLLQRFAAIVGERHALRGDPDMAAFLREPRNLHHGRAALVLRPGNVDEVCRILALATATGTPVVPQGGNTGLVGGQVPDASGRALVLSLSRLDRIRALDPASDTVIAEAGVTLQRLREAAEAVDRLFPLSLASQGSAQAGGLLSTNAGGSAVLAHGSMRALCLGLEVVLPTGERLDDLRTLRKDNTGYDLSQLFIGAEGTLGVITAAALRLVPRPRGVQSAWVAVASADAALALFALARRHAGNALTAFELIGETVLAFVLAHVPGTNRPLDAGTPWSVLLEVSSQRSHEDARGMVEAGLKTACQCPITKLNSRSPLPCIDSFRASGGPFRPAHGCTPRRALLLRACSQCWRAPPGGCWIALTWAACSSPTARSTTPRSA